jgi:hypothetical protein
MSMDMARKIIERAHADSLGVESVEIPEDAGDALIAVAAAAAAGVAKERQRRQRLEVQVRDLRYKLAEAGRALEVATARMEALAQQVVELDRRTLATSARIHEHRPGRRDAKRGAVRGVAVALTEPTTCAEVARRAGVSVGFARVVLDELLSERVVRITGKRGQAVLYTAMEAG